MKSIFVAFYVVFFTLCSQVAVADYQDGIEAYNKQDGIELYNKNDFATAFPILKVFAQNGDIEAQFALGEMLFHGNDSSFEKNYQNALEWYLKSANQGYSPAQFSVGNIYHLGHGASVNFPKAIYWYLKAGEQGHAEAQSNLGYLFNKGIGTETDKKVAVNWYRKSADQGFPLGITNLAAMYKNGEGVPKDISRAIELYEKAALLDEVNAQFQLGMIHYKGQGVVKDYVQAYKWWNVAASNGHETAANNLKAIEQSMTIQQIQYAQKISRSWRKDVQESSSKDLFTGTGFYITFDGKVFSNNHVVEGCKGISVNGYKSKVLNYDKQNDLAVLQGKPNSEIATFREGKSIRLGDEIIAAGFPLRGILADGLNISTGTVSALSGIENNSNELQISAVVNPGNSGGPLMDHSGNVVGIVSSRIDAVKSAKVLGSTVQGANFAIKASTAMNFLDTHGIAYATQPSISILNSADISQKAMKFTVLIQCEK